MDFRTGTKTGPARRENSNKLASVAQLDRAPDFYSDGRGFESYQGRYTTYPVVTVRTTYPDHTVGVFAFIAQWTEPPRPKRWVGGSNPPEGT